MTAGGARGVATAARGGRSAFGGWLQSWRHQARVTQRQLADDLGYDVTYIVKIEGGARPPSRQFLARLAHVVGEPVEELVRASAADVSRPPLPQPPGPLLGREDDLQLLVALLGGSARCATLVGSPGIGKSRLAMEAAAHLDGILEEGAWWVSLLDAGTAADVPALVRRTLGLAEMGGVDPVDAVVARLRSHRGLLVFDNFEHVLEARGLLVRLLDGCSRLAVLATSREPLGIPGEHVHRVGPLAYPHPSSPSTVAEASASPAVQLFASRARMARADFEVTAENLGGVVATCAEVGGVPLSIVLAAGEMTTMSPEVTARRLREGRPALSDVPADLPARQRSLDAAMATSWEALEPAEAGLLAVLAVFCGGFTAPAAAAVHGAGLDTTDAALGSLVRKSLVEARPDAPGGPRFELLPPVRAFAMERLRAGGRFARAQRLHLAHLLAVAEECGRQFLGGDQARSVTVLDAERENLAAAFEWALAHDPEAAVALAAALWRYFLKGDIPTGRRWLAEALAGGIEETPERATALAAAGALGWVSGDRAVATARLGEAAKLAERLELPDVMALVALNEAALAEQQDRLEDAEEWFGKARHLYDQLGDRRGRAMALNGLGVVRRRRGDPEGAVELWGEAAGLLRAVGDGFTETLALGNLARAAEDAGRYQEARRWNGIRRRVQITLGDARGLAATTAALGRLAHKSGDRSEALALFSDALAGFHRLGDRPWAASTLLGMAAVAAESGHPVEASLLAGAARGLWDGMGAHPRADEVEAMDALVEEARAALGPAAFAGTWRAALALTLDEAVKIAAELEVGDGQMPPPTTGA
ncbi:MAG: ATP-binding protein [Acidimicrobiia bacterium]